MNYLLASHGTAGALAAEIAAIDFCTAGDHLDHLIVIPEWWSGMTGDDWLNSGASRNRYRDYLTAELNNEKDAVVSRVNKLCQLKSIYYNAIASVGDSSEVLEMYVKDGRYEKIFIGSRRPSSCEGINDRMLTKKILKAMHNKLTVVAHPYAQHATKARIY